MATRLRLPHLRRVQLYAFGMPGALAALVLLLAGNYPLKVWLTVSVLVLGAWLFFSLRLQERISRPLQTASNMLSALREGDFSLQAAIANTDDPLGQVMDEINRLTAVLASHRMGAIEAHALLDKVVDEIDAAVFTFNPQRQITLANRAARKVLGLSAEDKLHGRYAGEFDLDAALDAPSRAMIPSPTGHVRYTTRRGTFREGGEPHELLILIDVTRPLREEELTAWKRLIRVLGHELNNSLTPIKSMASSAQKLVSLGDLDEEDREDLTDSLSIIESRADGLSRFVHDYARLAKLPPPSKREIDLAGLVRRVSALSERLEVHLKDDSPEVTLLADPDQLEQLLINLLKNAVEAALDPGAPALPEQAPPRVAVCWHLEDEQLMLQIEDTGPGIANPGNLFVPFFSTKPGGSGIGLTLCRQIAEAHEGSLTLENRDDWPHGSRATLRLPLG